MKFFIYCNFGMCQHGDHSCGIEATDTIANARIRGEEFEPWE